MSLNGWLRTFRAHKRFANSWAALITSCSYTVLYKASEKASVPLIIKGGKLIQNWPDLHDSILNEASLSASKDIYHPELSQIWRSDDRVHQLNVDVVRVLAIQLTCLRHNATNLQIYVLIKPDYARVFYIA